ncbi:nucleotide exchange factor GrpE [Bacillaceae bacterium Marseille-Q3522]|nr:nucleotide exchange factor GrpE [Bacillaceae bacterium Marseille-Q3522]
MKVSEEKNVVNELEKEDLQTEEQAAKTEEITESAAEEITADSDENAEASEPEVSGAEKADTDDADHETLNEALEKVAMLEKKLDDEKNRYLRLQADYENSRRRARLDLEAANKYRAQTIISEIIPAIDNFERALQVEAEDEKVKSLLQGMEMVYRSLLQALKKEGAEPIEAVGKEFDPHLHQAVMQVSDPSYESNIVVEEFQKGYRLKDRVIRPSMVKVNQ